MYKVCRANISSPGADVMGRMPVGKLGRMGEYERVVNAVERRFVTNQSDSSCHLYLFHTS